MTLWIFAFLIPAVLCAFAAKYFFDKDFEFMGFVFIVICTPLFIISLTLPVCELDSARKAKFYNTNFKTSYTANDFFWNSEEIEAMLIGKKVRVYQ
jgi:hypothetical protein